MPTFPVLKSLLALFIICCSLCSFASDHIIERGYWQDDTAQATFEQAKVQNYKSYEGVLSRGYTQSAIWIRLFIAPTAGEEKLVLRIRPVYLDEITLFDPLDASTKTRKVGDTARYEDSEFKSLNHTFLISAVDKPRYVWLRLKTTSTSLISINAFSNEEMISSEFDMHLGYFAVLAINAMFMLLVLINWLNYRESLYAFFVSRQVYFFFYTVSLFGFHRLLLTDLMDPEYIDHLYSWIVIGATAMSVMFEYKFLSEYSPPYWAKVIFRTLLTCSACIFGLMLFGYGGQALKFNMMLNTVSMITLLFLSAAFVDDKKSAASSTASLLSKKIVVGYYAFINSVLVFTILPYLGLMKGNEFALNGLVFYTLFSGLVMTLLMQFRANKIRQAQSLLESELIISKKEVELEKLRREEKTHLFHMLMHELKNPLAIIEMAFLAKNNLEKTNDYVSRAVKNMKDILDRCVKTDRLAEGNIVVNKEQIQVKNFLNENLLSDSRENFRIELDIPADLMVNTDAQFFEIMLSNLIDNALRYGDQLTPIQVKAQSQKNSDGESGVNIIVSNKPGGASWPDASRLFTKYYRSAGAEAKSGTGLGLYLVRALANLAGGECWYSPDQTDIRFELWLPS